MAEDVSISAGGPTGGQMIAFLQGLGIPRTEITMHMLASVSTFLATHGGTPLRDWFAGQLIVNFAWSEDANKLATNAYRIADAMLEARKAKPRAGVKDVQRLA